MKLVSVVVPCYNEQEVLPMFYEEITKVTDQMSKDFTELTFEYLFINDGSKDKTLEILRSLAEKDKRVRYISFSRNFGKESGMYAGLQNAKGDFVVVMDADLQHPPSFLPEMYSYVRYGEYDCATTRRVSRKGESKVRSWFARLFYRIMNKISQTEIVDGAQDFRFMTRQMVDAILDMSEYNRFSKGIFSWVGFNTRYIEYENVERPAGTSSFSTAPLAIASLLGIITCLFAFVLIVITIIRSLFGWLDAPDGYPTMLCLIFLFSGLQLFCVGILGQYLSKTYLETKNRPIYITKETEELFLRRKAEAQQDGAPEKESK